MWFKSLGKTSRFVSFEIILCCAVTAVLCAPIHRRNSLVSLTPAGLLPNSERQLSSEATAVHGNNPADRNALHGSQHRPSSSAPYIEVHNSTYRGAGPREEARAMCSVRTLEVNATANATITRRLHGVATSRELHSSIHRLEVVIYGQMQQLWQSLDALRAHMAGGDYQATPDRRTVAFRYQPHFA